jgi:hypothetical protein
MADNDKKPLAHILPAIPTGAAALIAALTTVYVNVRDDKPAVERAQATQAVEPAPTASPVAATERKPEKFRLQLERIAVQHDGSVGTTDWRFAVEANGQPLFVFGQDDLDDTGGRNVALPKDVGATLRLLPGQPNTIAIKGWRGSRLRLSTGAPDVQGEGVIGDGGIVAPVEVKAGEPASGTFVFYFSASPE